MPDIALHWFRRDLRLADNPALRAAAAKGRRVVPVFILDDAAEGDQAMGAASRWWLHYSLAALSRALDAAGCPLVLRRGDSRTVLAALAEETGADRVTWTRIYDPWAVERDGALKAALKAEGLKVESHPGALLREPWEVKTQSGTPFGVFTPFWKALLALGDPPAPAPAPTLRGPDVGPRGDALADWDLTPRAPDWAGGLRAAWTPGEDAAKKRLEAFLAERLCDYPATRDRPGDAGTSALSAHLRFGEIGPRTVWHTTLDAVRSGRVAAGEDAAMGFLRELGWRDFNHSLLFHNPGIPQANYNTRFDGFPWRRDADALAAWQAGRTGYPIVDAGMRELWDTGFMHNRVRMIAASFLIKDLMIDWRLGEAWFRDTLVDADLANNVANWQWVAGSGADAAPYFRIFNPVLQGEKFDRDGAYTRRWVPELAGLPDKYIHRPWDAPTETLARAGVEPGKTYPRRIVDHAAARQRALAAYERIKGAA